MKFNMASDEAQNLLIYGTNKLFNLGALNFDKMPLSGLFLFQAPDGETDCAGMVSPHGCIAIMYGLRKQFAVFRETLGDEPFAKIFPIVDDWRLRKFCRALVTGRFSLVGDNSSATIELLGTNGSGRAASELMGVILPAPGLAIIPACQRVHQRKWPINVGILRQKGKAEFVDCDENWKPIRALTAAELRAADCMTLSKDEIASLYYTSEARNSSRPTI